MENKRWIVPHMIEQALALQKVPRQTLEFGKP